MKQFGSVVCSLLALVAVLTWSPTAAGAAARKPVITSVIADTGSATGYAHLVIRGRHLTGASVSVGGHRASSRVLDDSTVVVYPEGRRAGRVTIVARTAAGRSNTAYYRFVTVPAPTIWTAQQASVPTGGSAAVLRYAASDCPSADVCVSVGTDDFPVARVVKNGRETLTRLPLPADAGTVNNNVTLNFVSCASTNFCVAGGEYLATDPTFAGFFATWNGSTWRSVRAPKPVPGDDEYGELNGLSCGAPGSCTAITQGSIYTLARGSWSAATPRLPSGTDNARLSGVSCTSASYCVVTGTGDRKGGTAMVVLVRDGTAQNALRLLPPASWARDVFGPELSGLDCAANRHCVIVAYPRGGGPRYLVSLDKLTFTYHRVPNPADGTKNAYGYRESSPVSCPTVSTCWVLDAYTSRKLPLEQGYVPVAIRLQAGKIRVFALPDPAPLRPARTELSDLDCPTWNSCVAVGSRMTDGGDPATREAVVESYAGGVWTPSRPPRPKGLPAPFEYQLTDVDCARANRCLATGTYRWDRRDGDDDFHFTQGRSVFAQAVRR